jgi:hypothetical protein
MENYSGIAEGRRVDCGMKKGKAEGDTRKDVPQNCGGAGPQFVCSLPRIRYLAAGVPGAGRAPVGGGGAAPAGPK